MTLPMLQTVADQHLGQLRREVEATSLSEEWQAAIRGALDHAGFLIELGVERASVSTDEPPARSLRSQEERRPLDSGRCRRCGATCGYGQPHQCDESLLQPTTVIKGGRDVTKRLHHLRPLDGSDSPNDWPEP